MKLLNHRGLSGDPTGPESQLEVGRKANVTSLFKVGMWVNAASDPGMSLMPASGRLLGQRRWVIWDQRKAGGLSRAQAGFTVNLSCDQPLFLYERLIDQKNVLGTERRCQ